MPQTTLLTPGTDATDQPADAAVPATPSIAPVSTTPAPDVAVSDRRRPGRSSVHPVLVPLLRQPGSVADQSDAVEEWEDRAPGRGLVIGVSISILFWAIGLVALFFALS